MNRLRLTQPSNKTVKSWRFWNNGSISSAEQSWNKADLIVEHSDSYLHVIKLE